MPFDLLLTEIPPKVELSQVVAPSLEAHSIFSANSLESLILYLCCFTPLLNILTQLLTATKLVLELLLHTLRKYFLLGPPQCD